MTHPTIRLDRQALTSGALHELARRQPGNGPVMSDAERDASLAATLAAMPTPGRGDADRDVWVFGYGSLIWNPVFDFVEKRACVIHGLHRRFCLWTRLGRGDERQPGLVLGLDRGGSCRGVAFRIDHERLVSELDLVWRRELLSYAYEPVWVRARSAAGIHNAIAMRINRRHERYAERLSDRIIVDTIATAAGWLGPCHDYLFQTVRHLDQLGLHDRRLSALARHVQARIDATAD